VCLNQASRQPGTKRKDQNQIAKLLDAPLPQIAHAAATKPKETSLNTVPDAGIYDPDQRQWKIRQTP
jgi:hypothetical protein